MELASIGGLIVALGLVGCAGDRPKVEATFNEDASLSSGLPANPFDWQVVTLSVDSANSTMETLYGNDVAIRYARTNAQHDYPAGSSLSLVTWKQREDPRYFGGRIPGEVKSVEFITVRASADGHPQYSYEEYEGKPFAKVTSQDSSSPTGRAAYLLSQRAAVLP